MFCAGGGGEIGYDLLVDVGELRKLAYVTDSPLVDEAPMKRTAIETRIVKALKYKTGKQTDVSSTHM